MKRIVLLVIVGAAFFFATRALTGLLFSGPSVPPGQDIAGGGVAKIELQGRFDPTAYAIAGQPTVIEFYSDNCPGCRRLHQMYERFLKARPDVAIRQVHLRDGWDPRDFYVEHGVLIRAVPHVIVFGPDGSLLAMDTPEGFQGYEFLLDWIEEETGRR